MTDTTKLVLLKAGKRAFMAHGFEGAGITEILTGTNLSRGAFYHHFESKMGLYEAVIGHFFPSPIATLDWTSHTALDAASQKSAIRALYEKVVSMSLDDEADPIRHFTLFFDSLSRLPAYRALTDRAYAQVIESLQQAFEREGVRADVAYRDARAFIARFEGELYLWAVNGTAPQFAQDTNQ